MPKGYWIAHVQVTDPERYKDYTAANAAPIRAYGGRFIVRGGSSQVRAGALKERHVVVEFPDYAAAKACYDSAEYQAAAKIRDTAGKVDLVVIEGYEG
ncbi:MAG TPA: DUF1330 domain-containing protein [Hyphomicrobiaceae bacterium]|jgi:uncharacterized protein (DUF1330 family)|nr:DUF1330 domain-containing protein [Hyphomicrobiaceae bacterium]